MFLLGWPSPSWRVFAYKAVVALSFVGYYVQATWRFRGILKSPQPYSPPELAVLSLKVLMILVVLAAVCGGVVRLVLLALGGRESPNSVV